MERLVLSDPEPVKVLSDPEPVNRYITMFSVVLLKNWS